MVNDGLQDITRCISSHVPSVLPPSTKIISSSEQKCGIRDIATEILPSSFLQGIIIVVDKASIGLIRGWGLATMYFRMHRCRSKGNVAMYLFIKCPKPNKWNGHNIRWSVETILNWLNEKRLAMSVRRSHLASGNGLRILSASASLKKGSQIYPSYVAIIRVWFVQSGRRPSNSFWISPENSRIWSKRMISNGPMATILFTKAVSSESPHSNERRGNCWRAFETVSGSHSIPRPKEGDNASSKIPRPQPSWRTRWSGEIRNFRKSRLDLWKNEVSCNVLMHQCWRGVRHWGFQG